MATMMTAVYGFALPQLPAPGVTTLRQPVQFSAGYSANALLRGGGKCTCSECTKFMMRAVAFRPAEA